MSANNQILINRKMYRWEVRHIDVDSLYEYGIDEGTLEILGETDNLEEAVDIANKFMLENEVEYGINIIK